LTSKSIFVAKRHKACLLHKNFNADGNLEFPILLPKTFS
jgi:hypothetical protein